MTRGVYLAFLGIDGVGKTTLANRLVAELTGRGVKVRKVSWRDTVSVPGATSWPVDALQEVWLDTFRLLFGGARTDDGEPLRLPRTFAQWHAEGWEDRLATTRTAQADRSGPLAAALAELAGNLVLTDSFIRPLVEQGYTVVQETFPYKHVLKELLVAGHISAEESFAGLVAVLEVMTREVFSSDMMQPDVGVHVVGTAEQAYRWKMAQSGRLGVLEDLSAAGRDGEQSYITLQTQTAGYFTRACAQWGWITHEVDDQGLESNVARGLATILGDPRMAALR